MIKKKRSFISSVLKLSLVLLLNQIGMAKKVKAKNKPKVVVLGAGFGGASCISYLSNFTDLIDLVVVDKNKWIKTCPFSNLVIGFDNFKQFNEINNIIKKNRERKAISIEEIKSFNKKIINPYEWTF